MQKAFCFLHIITPDERIVEVGQPGYDFFVLPARLTHDVFYFSSFRQHCFLRSPTTETTSNHFMRCSASWAPS